MSCWFADRRPEPNWTDATSGAAAVSVSEDYRQLTRTTRKGTLGKSVFLNCAAGAYRLAHTTAGSLVFELIQINDCSSPLRAKLLYYTNLISLFVLLCTEKTQKRL